MEAAGISETSVNLYDITRRNMPEDSSIFNAETDFIIFRFTITTSQIGSENYGFSK